MKIQKVLLSLLYFLGFLGWVELKVYEMTIESLETAFGSNDRVLKMHDLRVKKFNRTAQVLNGGFELLTDLDDNWTFEIHANNFQGNQYKRMLSKGFGKFCEGLYRDEIKTDFEKGANYITPHVAWKTCPVRKSLFNINNFIFDDVDELLPPYIPGNEKWEIQLRFSKDGEVLGGYNVYLIIRSQQSLMNGG